MAIKMKTTVKLKADADCPTHSLSNVTVRDLNFAIDEPVERGGSNLGPTPTDTALAALAGCTNVIAHKCANKLGIDLGHITVNVVCDFNRLGVTLTEEIDVPFEKIIQKVTYDGSANADEIKQLQEEVSKFCPLSKLFKQAGTIIEEEWSQAI